MTDSSGLGDDGGYDPLKEARAYNDSILFMLSVPYVVLAVAGIAIFVAVRRHRALLARLQAEAGEAPGAVLPVS
jgi:hypothetical protein